MSALPDHADVIVVGAGPAGLSAATELKRLGVGSVHVLDREAMSGGIPRHCGHSPYGMREFRRVMGGPAYAARLTAGAAAAGAVIHTDTTVTKLGPRGAVSVTTPDGPFDVTARAVLLAMGARESSRVARMLGGTKPGGVMNTGALQGLVYLNGQRPFLRPVILGTELVSFSALLTCRHAGARPAAMINPGAAPTARWPAAILPRLLRVPLLHETDVIAIHGRDRVEGVTLRHAGQSRQLACDGVILTGGFRPENALLHASHLEVDPQSRGPVVDQYGRLSDPSYFAAGNLLRPVETAGWCWDEGRSIAHAIATDLTTGLPDRTQATPMRARHSAIAWTVPQVLSAGGPAPALDGLQMHVSRPVSGTLRYGGRSARINARPERRIVLPLPVMASDLRLEVTE